MNDTCCVNHLHYFYISDRVFILPILRLILIFDSVLIFLINVN